MTRRPTRASLSATAGLILSLVVVGATVVATRNEPDPTSQTSAAKAPSIPFGELLQAPLDGGQRVTLSQLRSRLPFPVALPTHEMAREQSIVGTWTNPQNRGALTFDSGILLEINLPEFADSLKEFSGLISSGSLPNGRLVTVHGRPALAIEANTDQDGSNPAALQFVRGDRLSTAEDGVSYTLYAEALPVSDLIEIAETIPA